MKFSIKVIITIIIMINTSFLNAEVVNQVEINGNSRVSDETGKQTHI